jgi:hypothetical protein
MRQGRPIRSTPRLFAAALMPLCCTGCAMLGELFATPGLRIVVVAVVALAAVAFLMSRSRRP